MARRKPRKSLELCEVIKEVKAGKPIDDVCVQFGISKSQAYQLYKDKDALQVSALSGSVPVHSKFRKNKARTPEIDRAVFDWFCSVRSFRGAGKSLPGSRTLVKARALHEADVRGLDFKALNGWFSNWRWRFNVSKYVKLHGEAGDVDMLNRALTCSVILSLVMTQVMYLTWMRVGCATELFPIRAMCCRMRGIVDKLVEVARL